METFRRFIPMAILLLPMAAVAGEDIYTNVGKTKLRISDNPYSHDPEAVFVPRAEAPDMFAGQTDADIRGGMIFGDVFVADETLRDELEALPVVEDVYGLSIRPKASEERLYSFTSYPDRILSDMFVDAVLAFSATVDGIPYGDIRCVVSADGSMGEGRMAIDIETCFIDTYGTALGLELRLSDSQTTGFFVPDRRIQRYFLGAGSVVAFDDLYGYDQIEVGGSSRRVCWFWRLGCPPRGSVRDRIEPGEAQEHVVLIDPPPMASIYPSTLPLNDAEIKLAAPGIHRAVGWIIGVFTGEDG